MAWKKIGPWDASGTPAANLLFDDDPKYFLPCDKFENPIVWLEARSTQYLMVPYSELNDKPAKTIQQWRSVHVGQASFLGKQVVKVANYQTVQPEDKNWIQWAETSYGNTWAKLRTLNDMSDRSFRV